MNMIYKLYEKRGFEKSYDDHLNKFNYWIYFLKYIENGEKQN